MSPARSPDLADRIREQVAEHDAHLAEAALQDEEVCLDRLGRSLTAG